MNKIKIRVANEHVEHLVKELAEYNPVAVDLPDFLPHTKELKDIEFDLESENSFFVSRIFFAGVTYGIKTTKESISTYFEKAKSI